jgi:5-methylcytosine-specific restriction endonuclease McrA
MTFREELNSAKREAKAAQDYKRVCERRIAHNISLDDIPSYVGSQKNSAYERSPEWKSVRKTHLMSYPCCAICGLQSISNLEVHHVLPFCLFPTLELDPNNLITLCEIGIDGCHSDFGHPLGTQSYNPIIRQHAALLNKDFSRLEEMMASARSAAILV